MMKNIFYSAAILLLVTSCSKTNVSITGNIKEAGRQKVYLEQLNVDKAVIVDSTESDKNGSFKFKTTVGDPTFFNLKFGDKENITFIAAKDENIEISGNFKGLTQNYWVDGSENSLWIKLLNFQLHNTVSQMDSLQKRYLELSKQKGNETERQTTAMEWDSIVKKQISFSQDFILKHAISPASYYALYQKFDDENFILNPVEHLHSYKVVASSLKAVFPESQYTKAIMNHLVKISKNIQNEQIRQLIANSEGSLPQIKLPNIKKDSIELNSLKGKFIILDFSLLTAQGSKNYIQDLKKVYNKFKNKGLLIYQVCLDDNQLLWEKQVRNLGIDWICVHDVEGLKSRTAKSWNIQNIPANYIINPKFEIVGKNLEGKRLEERLNDLIK